MLLLFCNLTGYRSVEMKWILILAFGCSLAETTLAWNYHYSKVPMNWTKAREWCQTHYTDMVVLQNQKENDYLISILPNRRQSPYYWIGITKKNLNETWTWVGNNSTWIGEDSWAANEPNNNHITEFCVEIYVNKEANKGKWNDEKCANKKFAVCYKTQCEASTCERGRCQETIENTTCACEPGFQGLRCEKAVECPALSHPKNGQLSCSEGSHIVNTSCRFTCDPGFLVIGSSAVTCEVTAEWSDLGPTCASYIEAVSAVLGFCALLAFCGICFCWIKHRKKKKVAQTRQPDDDAA